MSSVTAISLKSDFDRLTLLPDRQPDTKAEGWFSETTAYRDGAIFFVHYAGNGEWERHSNGDEIVYVAEGSTTLVLLSGGQEERTPLNGGQLVVIPQNMWHRFESPQPVKVMTVTPQPTDHSAVRPE
jgi:mannose-6-phosphate isomerase-like protein (cupin superfamily)